MSGDLVGRLRAQATVLAEDHPAVPTWVLDSLSAAAAHIEALEAELGTLAEIVAIISPRVERDAYGLGIVAGRNFYGDSRWTETDGERFRAVLDRITKETGDE